MSHFISNAFQVPNAVIDELMAKLSPNALKCYLLIVRKTTGWGKECDRISESQFMEKTGIKNVKTVRSAMSELSELSLIHQSKKRGQITEYSLVKEDENQCQKTVVPKNGTSTKKRTEVAPKNGTTTSTKNWHPTKTTIKTTNTKEKNITKKTSTVSLDELDFSVFGDITEEQIQEIIRIRKTNAKKLPTQRVLKLLAAEFNKASTQHGLSLSDCLDEWEFRGWQGFKSDWIKNGKRDRDEDINWDSTGWGADLNIR